MYSILPSFAAWRDQNGKGEANHSSPVTRGRPAVIRELSRWLIVHTRSGDRLSSPLSPCIRDHTPWYAGNHVCRDGGYIAGQDLTTLGQNDMVQRVVLNFEQKSNGKHGKKAIFGTLAHPLIHDSNWNYRCSHKQQDGFTHFLLGVHFCRIVI
ncbi:hypothetical protein IQ06DRAFT_145062 [Phaeosphaeriaceae sp. SRC1lsM3a]|nr:hypothetical protein IQ06DRAFT_145062 [Stagonospora sp. SRC1lsM3a]